MSSLAHTHTLTPHGRRRRLWQKKGLESPLQSLALPHTAFTSTCRITTHHLTRARVTRGLFAFAFEASAGGENCSHALPAGGARW